MQRKKSSEKDTRIVISFIDRRRLAVDAEERINCGLRGSDGIFNREDDVIVDLAELADEGKVL